MSEPHERLALARDRAGYRTASDAARAMGIPIPTYSAHENSSRGFPRDAAVRYARFYRVSLDWLLKGEGSPGDAVSVVAIAGLVSAGGRIETAAEQPDSAMVQLELPVPVPPDSLAFEIVGDSMWPRYDAGDVIVCSRFEHDINRMIGWEGVVGTEDGSRYLKRILRGSSEGRFDLESHNAPPMRNVRVTWASEISLVIRAAQVKRLTRAEFKKIERRYARSR